MRFVFMAVVLPGLSAGALWADIAPLGTIPGPVSTYYFSDGKGDAGYVGVTLSPTTLGDGSDVATSGTLDLTSSSSLSVPIGLYDLEILSGVYWAISQLGAFSADNLVYPADNANSSLYETTQCEPYYVCPINSPSYLTQGGLVFENKAETLEINIFGAGGGNYEFYAGWGAGDYPIAQASGVSVSVPEPEALILLLAMIGAAAARGVPGAMRRNLP